MKYFIKTFGCQMNKADSLWLERIFAELGYTKVDSLEEADVVLVNSCSVRQAAEDKVYGLAKKIQPRKAVAGETRPIPQPPGKPRRFPQIQPPRLRRRFSSGGLGNAAVEKSVRRVILTGCMVGSATGERRRIKLSDLRKKMPWVDYFIPPGEIFAKLPSILSSEEAICERVRSLLGSPGAVVFGEGAAKEAYVPVMRGCDRFCSYCAVPYGRGKEVSRSMEEIVSEVKKLVKRGVKKVTLLGQNVNAYGFTNEFESESNRHEYNSSPFEKHSNRFEKRQPFAELLRELHEIEGLEKIWFLTSNPWDFTDDLINALALPKIEKYLHLPVQSGDDEILKKMNRPYTAAEYKNLVRKIRDKVPEMRFGTDIIVGFPGETVEQFQNTVDLVKKIRFEGAFVAMYSPRSGTAAARLYEDDVPQGEKRRRHKIILDLVKKERGRKRK